MKAGSKLLAFVTIFVMILGNVFTSLPFASACPAGKVELVIKKVDAVSGVQVSPSGQARFTVERWNDSTGKYVVLVTNWKDGDQLPGSYDPGKFRITETKAPDAYLLNATPLEITLGAGDTGRVNYVSFGNQPKGKVTITKDVLGTTSDSTKFDLTITGMSGGRQVYKSTTEYIRESSSPHSVTLTNLPYGTYTVVEDPDDLAPKGYAFVGLLVDGVAADSFIIDATTELHNISVVVQNEKTHPSITVTKSITNGTPPDGTIFTFSIWKKNTGGGYTQIGASQNVVWGTNNSVKFGYPDYDLEDGKDYYIRESTPAGYTPQDGDFAGNGKKVTACVGKSIECKNVMSFGKVKVCKTIASGQSTSEKFIFDLTWPDGTVQKSPAIGVGEFYVFENLPYGNYTITEEPKAGFSSTPLFSGDVTIDAHGVAHVNVNSTFQKNVSCQNGKLFGKIVVTKSIGSETMADGDQFIFRLYKGTSATGSPIATKTITKTSGMTCTFDGLEYGQYCLTEESVGSFTGTPVFSGDINASTGVVNVNGNKAVTCTNSKCRGKIVVTKSIGSETMADGDQFIFKLYKGTSATGSPIATKTITKTSGMTCTFDGLEYGQYCLTEESVGSFTGTPVFSGDINASTGVVNVNGNKAVTCTNSKCRGKIVVTKSIGSETMADGDQFIFKLYKGTSATGSPIATKTITKTSGMTCTFDGLEYGQYCLTEESVGSFTGTPVFSGDINASTGVVNVNGNKAVTCTNSKLYGSIVVTKCIGFETMGYADQFTFKLYKGTTPTGTPIATRTILWYTGMTCSFTGLEYGQYCLTEESTGAFNGTPVFSGDINASTGVVNVNGNKAVTCTNSKLRAKIVVTKSIGSETMADGDQFIFKLYKGTTPTGSPIATKTITKTSGMTCTFDGLEYGQYCLTEESVGSFTGTPVFSGDINASTGVVNVNGDKAVTCTNSKLRGKIVVTKSIGSETMADGDQFIFKLYKGTSATGSPIATKTITKTSGMACTFDDLEYGPYYLTEESVGSFNGTPVFSGDIDSTQVVNVCGEKHVTCTNYKNRGSIVVTKSIGSETMGDDDQFIFKLYKGTSAAGELVGTGTITKTSGMTCTFGGLEYGQYYLTETIEGSFNGTPVFSGDINASTRVVNVNGDKAVTCTNSKLRGKIVVTKCIGFETMYDGDQFIFRLYKGTSAAGELVGTKTITKTSGMTCTFSGLEYGQYYLTEESVGSFNGVPVFSGDINASTGVVNVNGNKAVSCTNSKLRGSIIVTKSIGSETMADGDQFIFKLYKGTTPTGLPIATKTITKTSGMTCTFSGLEYGQYCLTETSVGSFNGVPVFSGDINASTGVVNVNGSKAVTCTNSKLRGSISVTKAFTNDDTPADGTPFEFTLWEGGVQVQGPLTVYWTSGGSNSVTFTGLDYGHTYTVKETEQSGYINATGDVPVLVDEASEAVTISNTKNIGGLSITKALDSDAGDHTSFQFTIAGPSFPAGGHGFTLEGGQTTSFSDLLYGTYTITETPTAGYELTGISGGGGTQAGNVFTVTLSGENQGFTVTASNRKLGSLTITKAMLDGETVTPVFNFEITGPGGYSDTFQLQLSTDPANPVKASKTFDNLAFGDYTITEIPADGYALAGFACGTGSGSGNSWTVTVGSETRAIGITATNRALGKLEITKKSSYDNAPLGEAVFQVTSVADPSVTFQLTTASTGADKGKVTSGWLVPGDYKVKEITPPDGYAIDDDAEYTVTVNPGMTTSGVEGTVFTDSPGKVMVYKYSSFGRTPVANVRFQLLSEPPDANGDPLPGSMIREQLTNASGVAVFENLMIGHKYWVREIQQAEHYDIDRSIVIEVTAALDPSKVPAARADFTNNPLARVSIVKYDASTVVGGDYSGATKVGGALYGIYDNAACAGAPVATITTSASGPVESVDLKFTTELHTYYVKEITAPAGFLLSDEVQTVDFNTPGQVAALRFSDLRSTGALIIKKTDFTSGDPLAGAKFALYSDEACTVQVGATLTTGADGIARFDNLEPGNYWLVETEAPKDYDKMEGSLPVTVTAGVTAPDPIVITNTYNPPKHYDTGMMDWNFLLLGGMVVLAGLLLVLITRRRRTYVR